MESKISMYHPRQNKRIVRFLFVTFFLGQIFVNYDAGAIPSILESIKTSFNLTETLLGVLGALPYIGLMCGSPIVGLLLQTVSEKYLLIMSILTNILSVVMLATSFNVYLLFISRFLLGFTQSGFCIYCPVWVDEFASVDSISLWMGLVQGGTVLGVMVGYLFTGLLPLWRVSIGIQGVALSVLLLVFIFTPPVYLNIYCPPKASLPGTDPSERIIPKVSATECVGKLLTEDPSTVIGVRSASSDLHSLSTPTSTVSSTSLPRTDSRKKSGDVDHFTHAVTTGVDVDRLRGRSVRSSLRGVPFSFLAPSPAGALIETLEVAAYDEPCLISQTSVERQPSSPTDKEPPVEDSFLEVKMTLWEQFKLLFRSPIYIWTVVTLCGLFFVVTGVQYWMTNWLVVEKKIDEMQVHLLFSITAATAPTAGVLWGSFAVDRMGGYKTPKGMFYTLGFSLFSGVMATIAGVIAGYLNNFQAIIGLIWLLLFFGGSTLPPSTGILIAAVDPSVRSFASSFSMFAYNLFGYGLGTLLPGICMEAFGLNVGMHVIFLWSLFGVFGGLMALFFAWRATRVETPTEGSASAVLERITTISDVCPV